MITLKQDTANIKKDQLLSNQMRSASLNRFVSLIAGADLSWLDLCFVGI